MSKGRGRNGNDGEICDAIILPAFSVRRRQQPQHKMAEATRVASPVRVLHGG